jgi:peptide/nickel transport system substrate-binding protein
VNARSFNASKWGSNPVKFGILTALLVLAVACGPASGPGAVVAPTAAPPKVTPKTFVFASQVDLLAIDPAVGHDGATAETQKNVYNALVRHIGNPPKVVSELAESWEVSADAKEFTFKLKKNAKFHDGTPVTAEAVKFSFERLHRIKKGVYWMFSDITDPTSMTTPDDYTVKITLKKPFAPFLDAMTWLFIVNPKQVKANDKGDDGQAWLKDHDAGSGPFTVKTYKPGEIYEFDAVADYWGGWRTEGRLAGYVRRVVREPSTRKILLEKGEVDAIDWPAPDDMQLLKQNNNVVVPAEGGIGVYNVKLNNQKGYTADPNVRRAIAYAFDYDALIKIMGGLAILQEGPLSVRSPFAAKGLPIYRTDLEKAKAELAKSKWPNGGFELEFAYVQGLEEERLTGEIMLAQLSKLNIKVKITPMLWSDAVAKFQKSDTSPDMFPIYSGTDYPDADNFLWQAYHSSQAGFWAAASHYKNPSFDKILEDARSTSDSQKRFDLYKKAQEVLLQDAVEVYGFSRLGGLLRRAWVKGYEYSPVMGSPGWRDLWIEGRPDK